MSKPGTDEHDKQGTSTSQPGKMWHLPVSTPTYVLLLAAAIVIQAVWAPTWLVSSRSGLQTLAQSLPAALIALFALAFATLFVAVQQVTNVFSNRAPLILAGDVRVRRVVARTIIITAASLFLGGIIPDPPKPLPAYITAGGTTLLAASALLIYTYGRFSYLLIMDYSAPRSFVGHVVNPVADMIRQNRVNTGLVLYRVPLLGQTLRYALKRDDAETLYASLEGLQILQKLYVQATLKDPSLRSHRLSGTDVREGWLADELYRTYVGVCEEALRMQTPQHEIDEIVDYFGDATYTFITAHQELESKQMMTGLAQLATSPYQVMPGATNYLTRPASTLAKAERYAEQEGQPLLASLALANWAVAISYPQVHFGYAYHPLFEEGVRYFGDRPPWQAAIECTQNSSWSLQWANQLQNRLDFPISVLELARDLHEGSDGRNYKTRKRSVYLDWLNITRNPAARMIANASAFMRDLEGVNNKIFMFGSSDVQLAVRRYFGRYEEITTSLSESLVSAQGQVDELLRVLRTAFEQEAIAGARNAVLAAMSRDMAEDLELSS